MMSNPIVAFIVGVIVGSLVNVFVHFLTITRDRRKEFNKAAHEFRKAFWKEVQYLDRRYYYDRASAPEIYDIIKKAIGKHQLAIFKFRPYLNRFERIGFDKAWHEYCQHGSKSYTYLQEEYPSNGLSQKMDSEEKARRRIECLLSFAKSKQ